VEPTLKTSFSSNLRSTQRSRFGGVFSVEIIESRPGILIFEATGPSVADTFAHEAGGHRWQRVPPTEKHGRVQTSTVTVAVLPEPTETQVQIRDSDLEIQMIRGSGAGGQKRNKTNNCVMLKHRPSGLTVRCETERSLTQNRASALALLRARLWEKENDRAVGQRTSQRRQQVGSGMRGDKRRTIRADGVVDHVTGQRWEFKQYSRGDW